MKCVVCGGESVSRFDSRYGEQGHSLEWVEGHVFSDCSLDKCGSCESVFVSEPLDDEDISAWYSKQYREVIHAPASKFEIATARFYSRYFSQAMWIMQGASLPERPKVLEVGSNRYSIAPALSCFVEHDFYYYDQYPSNIISSYGGTHRGEFFTELSDEPTSEYDLVVSSHSLEHINPVNFASVFSKLASVVKEGGYIFIEVPFDVAAGIYYAPHTIFFTPKGLDLLLTSNGFSIVGALSYDEARGSMAPPTIAHQVPPQSRFTRILRFLVNSGLVKGSLLSSLLKLRSAHYLSKTRVDYDGRPYIRILGRKMAVDDGQVSSPGAIGS